ncbi:MAG: fatty acid desaturase [Acidimicrobiales bacterium]|nr:fatty acid desaturase [Acidimicrobiales bacterium]
MTATTTGPRLGGMVAPAEALPDVLPTDRLNETGKPLPEVREPLRRIASWRNALTVASLWATIVALFGLATWVHHPLGYAVLFVLMGPMFARLAILGHEAAHRLLFRDRRANDLVGRWLLDAPAFVPFDIYRRSHFAHHREEFGDAEPDLAYYAGYPMARDSFRRKLVRDAVGISGWKNFRPLLRALRNAPGRKVAGPILGVQLVIWAAIWAGTGRWWLYPLCWWGPWMTVWRVLNRLRSIAEHGGMEASKDRRRTTHHVRQTWAARFWVVPYRTGWHLAHHVDMGIPWRNLPALHRELVDAGWVTDAYVHRSYTAFWRSCIAR